MADEDEDEDEDEDDEGDDDDDDDDDEGAHPSLAGAHGPGGGAPIALSGCESTPSSIIDM